jgi:hypothetical protein
MAIINPFQAGFRLINGTHLNKIVVAVNNLTGGTGTTPGAVAASTLTANAIVGGATPLPITGLAAASATAAGGAVAAVGAVGGATSGTGGAASQTGGAGGGTGFGGISSIVGGASGAGATGNGGQAQVTGGAAASTNGNGGSVILAGGALAGTGANGMIIKRSVELVAQGVPAAATTSATLTAANILAGIITVNQGGAGASAQQLPLATAMDTAIPDSLAGDAFDFSVINISTVAAESASLTTNTGWTLVGDMDFSANSAATTKSAGRLRARKTAAGAWTLYRLS